MLGRTFYIACANLPAEAAQPQLRRAKQKRCFLRNKIILTENFNDLFKHFVGRAFTASNAGKLALLFIIID